MLWPVTASRTSSIPIRGRSLLARHSPACSPTTASPSAWTAKAPGGTAWTKLYRGSHGLRESTSRSLTCSGRAGPVRLLIGGSRLFTATDGKLTNRALDVEFDPRHLREQIDIGGADRTSTQPHIGRHHVERLDQYPDILQNQRIGDRAVLP